MFEYKSGPAMTGPAERKLTLSESEITEAAHKTELEIDTIRAENARLVEDNEDLERQNGKLAASLIVSRLRLRSMVEEYQTIITELENEKVLLNSRRAEMEEEKELLRS